MFSKKTLRAATRQSLQALNETKHVSEFENDGFRMQQTMLRDPIREKMLEKEVLIADLQLELEQAKAEGAAEQRRTLIALERELEKNKALEAQVKQLQQQVIALATAHEEGGNVLGNSLNLAGAGATTLSGTITANRNSPSLSGSPGGGGGGGFGANRNRNRPASAPPTAHYFGETFPPPSAASPSPLMMTFGGSSSNNNSPSLLSGGGGGGSNNNNKLSPRAMLKAKRKFRRPASAGGLPRPRMAMTNEEAASGGGGGGSVSSPSPAGFNLPPSAMWSSNSNNKTSGSVQSTPVKAPLVWIPETPDSYTASVSSPLDGTAFFAPSGPTIRRDDLVFSSTAGKSPKPTSNSNNSNSVNTSNLPVEPITDVSVPKYGVSFSAEWLEHLRCMSISRNQDIKTMAANKTTGSFEVNSYQKGKRREQVNGAIRALWSDTGSVRDFVDTVDSLSSDFRRDYLVEVAQQVRQLGELVRILNSVHTMATASLDVDELCSLFVREAVRILKASQARLYLVDERLGCMWLWGGQNQHQQQQQQQQQQQNSKQQQSSQKQQQQQQSQQTSQTATATTGGSSRGGGPGGSIASNPVPMTEGIAGYVARTKQLLNVPFPAVRSSCFSLKCDRLPNERSNIIICCPIVFAGSVLGVIQLFNRGRRTSSSSSSPSETENATATDESGIDGSGRTSANNITFDDDRNEDNHNHPSKQASFTHLEAYMLELLCTQAAVLFRRCLFHSQVLGIADRTLMLMTLTQNYPSEPDETYELMLECFQHAQFVLHAKHVRLLMCDRDIDDRLYLWFRPPGDVATTSGKLRVDFGEGIAGKVAQDRLLKNRKEEGDPVLDVHEKRKIPTRSLLCAPIVKSSGPLIGVVQVLDKIGSDSFTKSDEAFLALYCRQVAIGVEQGVVESAVARSKFVPGESLAQALDRGRLLLMSQRVFLFDVNRRTGEVTCKSDTGMISLSSQSGGLIGYVARSGLTVNVGDVTSDPRFDPQLDTLLGIQTRSILCTAVLDKTHAVVAVLCFCNKTVEGKLSSFSDLDSAMANVFAKQVGTVMSVARNTQRQLANAQQQQQ